ncbi:hypothetical protein [Candidatus Nitrososphaera evergladensis]|nr:hypothetical protein [Candidatus Nitrososphaera evergladensis]
MDRRLVPIVAAAGISMIVIGFTLPAIASMIIDEGRQTEGLGLRGNVDMILYDQSGNVKDERHLDNLIVSAGIEGVASRIAPHDGSVNPSAPYNYIALGTSNTPVDASQTVLSAELTTGANYARIQDTTALYSTASGNKLILSVTFGPGQATGTLRESGIFNSATGGNMLARQTFADIQKAAGDTLTVTWTITLSST